MELSVPPTPPLELRIGCRIYTVSNLSTSNGLFEVDMRLFFYYPEAYSSWNPKFGTHFYLNDSIEDPRIIEEPDPCLKNGEYRKGCRFSAKISQAFNLRDFPHDKQTLKVIFRISHPDKSGITAVVIKDSMCEWRGEGGVLGSWNFKELSQEVYCRAPGEVNFKPDYVVKVTLSRKPNFYLMNITSPLVMLVIMCFSCFLIDHEDLASRMSVILTVLLTCVAFKFSVASLLPVLDYETQLDRFTLSQFAIVFLAGLESMLVATLDNESAHAIDVIAGILCVVLVVGINGRYIITASRC